MNLHKSSNAEIPVVMLYTFGNIDSLMAKWLGCYTCNQQVAGSNPGCSAVECNPGKVDNTHVPLIKFSTNHWAVMPCSWEGNHRSGIALVMRRGQ